MSEPTSKTQTQKKTISSRRHYSPSGGNASITIGGAVGYIALSLTLVLMLFCYGLWSRYDLLRMFYEDIKTELIRTGHDVHPHLPMEKP